MQADVLGIRFGDVTHQQEQFPRAVFLPVDHFVHHFKVSCFYLFSVWRPKQRGLYVMCVITFYLIFVQGPTQRGVHICVIIFLACVLCSDVNNGECIRI